MGYELAPFGLPVRKRRVRSERNAGSRTRFKIRYTPFADLAVIALFMFLISGGMMTMIMIV
jgi:hypothetical protein